MKPVHTTPTSPVETIVLHIFFVYENVFGFDAAKNVFRLLSVGVPRSIEENVPPKSFSVVVRQQAEGLVIASFFDMESSI